MRTLPKVWVAQIADHSGPPIPCDNTSTFWTHVVSIWYGQKPLSMMVDMQQLSLIGILSTVSATGSAWSRIDQIWSTHLFGNMIRVGSDYTLRCIWQTGGWIHRDEIGPERFQVVGVSSANSPLCSLVENAAPQVNSGTHYRIVGPDSS